MVTFNSAQPSPEQTVWNETYLRVCLSLSQCYSGVSEYASLLTDMHFLIACTCIFFRKICSFLWFRHYSGICVPYDQWQMVLLCKQTTEMQFFPADMQLLGF